MKINYNDFGDLLTVRKAKENICMSRLLRAKLVSGKSMKNQTKKRGRYAEDHEVYNDAQKRPLT